MTDDRKSGLALIIGSIGTIITMALHPTGHDLFAPGRLDAVARMVVLVHALALVSIPVLFLGMLGLSRRLASPDRLSLAALVSYAFGCVSVMNAALCSGLVAPGLARQIVMTSSAASESADVPRMLFNYTGMLNHAFALVFVVASSVAILLWSASILRDRVLGAGVGVYGCVLGPLTLVAVLSGHLSLNVHGFGAVVLGQAIWYVAAGVLLWRLDARVRRVQQCGEDQLVCRSLRTGLRAGTGRRG